MADSEVGIGGEHHLRRLLSNRRRLPPPESFWKMTVYTAFTLLALAAAAASGILHLDVVEFWRGCNRFPPCNFPLARAIHAAYAVELGFYLQAVPALALFEVRRKDFGELMAHHVATIALIVYSLQVK